MDIVRLSQPTTDREALEKTIVAASRSKSEREREEEHLGARRAPGTVLLCNAWTDP
jgi:hypothetical protein